MELRQLRHFVAVVEAGNLSRAAGRVFISQPALTRSIKNLEDELGVQLLDRQPRGVVPTEAGKGFFSHAKLILNECGKACDDAAARAQGRRGKLAIGIGALFANRIVDRALARLMVDQPEIELEVEEGYFEELVERLREGRLDLVFINFPSVPIPRDLIAEPICDTDPAVIAGARHPLAQRQLVTRADLAEARWLVVNQRHAIDMLERMFSARALPRPDIALRTNSLPLIRALLPRGDFVTMLSASIMHEALERGSVVVLPVEDGTTRRHAGLIQRRDIPARPAAQTLIGLIRDEAERDPLRHRSDA